MFRMLHIFAYQILYTNTVPSNHKLLGNQIAWCLCIGSFLHLYVLYTTVRLCRVPPRGWLMSSAAVGFCSTCKPRSLLKGRLEPCTLQHQEQARLVFGWVTRVFQPLEAFRVQWNTRMSSQAARRKRSLSSMWYSTSILYTPNNLCLDRSGKPSNISSDSSPL